MRISSSLEVDLLLDDLGDGEFNVSWEVLYLPTLLDGLSSDVSQDVVLA